jgi:2-phospho-L-lactate/phosphoenolpyruvate guanylyltransferase
MIVPIKSFDQAKQRLAGALAAPERRALARQLAEGVLRAGSAWPTIVVCADGPVEALASQYGARIVTDPGGGLNAAVMAGISAAEMRGAQRVVVVHADLPLVEQLDVVLELGNLEPHEVLIVADRHNDGTNVLSIPTGTAFTVRYGRGSAAAHRLETNAVGLRVIERSVEAVALDIDTPEDLQEWHRRQQD